MMDHTVSAIVQQTGHTYAGQLLTGFFGLVVGQSWQWQAIPEQRLDVNTFVHGIAQDRLQGEGVGTPEVDVGLLETCCTQIDQQGLLLWITMRSCSLVFAAYDFHSGSEAPVS